MTKTNDTTKPHSHVAKSRSSWSSRIRNFLVYLVPVVLLILISLAEDQAPSPENSQEAGFLSILSSDFWYEHAVGSPGETATKVAVITVGRDMPKAVGENISDSVDVSCKRRVYLAKLLNVLSKMQPKVVVLDMWIDPASCSDSAATDALLNQVDELSRQIPVVFGLGAYNPSEILSSWPAEFVAIRNRKPQFKKTELVLIPAVHPARPGNTKVAEGMVELNSDNRKIPLSWPVYDGFEKVGVAGQPERRDSISVATARFFDPDSAVLQKLGAIGPDGSPLSSIKAHPYTSFLHEDQLPVIRAIDVICSTPTDSFWGKSCRTMQTAHIDLSSLRGKATVIGQAGLGGDVHPSLIGTVPGVILQANYIESLLTGRVFSPVPTRVQIVMGAIWLLFIVWVSWRFESSPGLALAFSVLAAIIPAYLMHLFILHFGYYTQLLLPLIIAALVVNISRQIERMIA